MKRKGHLYDLIISDANLRLAIDTVNKTHRWNPGHHPNMKVLYIEINREQKIKELREIIENGFVPQPTKIKKTYDRNARKWRDIHEPALWPDQYVHHALIQVLEPIMMRGMDYWCCGSIKGRGTQHGMKVLKKWMRYGKGVKYCAELDIRHFYDNLEPEVVMTRLRSLVKDYRTLDLCERILGDGVQIGAYTSQWFANTTLQPLDQMIHEIGDIKAIRYMDNFTLFCSRKKTLVKATKKISKWLEAHNLELKGNWQIFPIQSRMPNALGYKFGEGYTLMRKQTLLTLKREMRKYKRFRKKRIPIPPAMAYGLLSRIGRLRHCNSQKIYEKYIPVGTQKYLKNIIREYAKGELVEWNTLLEQYKEEAACGRFIRPKGKSTPTSQEG